ncbi:MAG: hydratase [Synergistaceae bacterium]|jgi:aconitate hydratase|nr:hydratase [Synergistaceae bacterium]
MIELYNGGAYLVRGRDIVPDDMDAPRSIRGMVGRDVSRDDARKGTMAHSILMSHNTGTEEDLMIKFDSMAVHDITSVSIVLTARASGMKRFPMPFVMTNCHNSMCAIGGTINEDDHVFALSAAKKYGGIFVSPNIAVIHSFMREMMAGCGRMILSSDSHTRYGALGTLATGEGGGELVKQLVGRTYDLKYPEVVAVCLTGKPNKGVGPHDVALSIIGEVFKNGYVKNKVMEFVGDGISSLSVDFRCGVDVMTTETACWSSIWRTDDAVREWFEIHGRPDAYREIAPADVAYYDGLILVDLSKIEPVIAMPFHPSNVYKISEMRRNARDIIRETEERAVLPAGSQCPEFKLTPKIRGGDFFVDQAVICGCSGGTYENIMAAAAILGGNSIGSSTFPMSVYPGSQPIYAEILKNGAAHRLMQAGAVLHPAFCGPCFGAGEIPSNGGLSIRHTTRNFPNREGSKPGEGQISSVALMDARSIAATALNGGRLTSAADLDADYACPKFFFDRGIYEKRVYDGSGRPDEGVSLTFGPNIKDWPEVPELTEHLLVRIVCYITDPVTTTDEIIPSGETSSYRSNPLMMAEFTFGRKDPGYLARAKEVQSLERKRAAGIAPPELGEIYGRIKRISGYESIRPDEIGIGSTIYANKPGDGSAREQAASCQRMLGASANLAREYATKRYRSNLLNWGIIPFLAEDPSSFELGDCIFFPNIRRAILDGEETIAGYLLREKTSKITTHLGTLTDTERQILADGCLINYYKNKMREEGVS